jgi:hypothetical protein
MKNEYKELNGAQRLKIKYETKGFIGNNEEQLRVETLRGEITTNLGEFYLWKQTILSDWQIFFAKFVFALSLKNPYDFSFINYFDLPGIFNAFEVNENELLSDNLFSLSKLIISKNKQNLLLLCDIANSNSELFIFNFNFEYMKNKIEKFILTFTESVIYFHYYDSIKFTENEKRKIKYFICNVICKLTNIDFLFILKNCWKVKSIVNLSYIDIFNSIDFVENNRFNLIHTIINFSRQLRDDSREFQRLRNGLTRIETDYNLPNLVEYASGFYFTKNIHLNCSIPHASLFFIHLIEQRHFNVFNFFEKIGKKDYLYVLLVESYCSEILLNHQGINVARSSNLKTQGTSSMTN